MNNPSAFPLGEPNDGFAQYFDGQSWLAPVLDAPEVSIHNVTFEPGCRNHWHIHHHAAQILIAVGGRGYYQLEGEEPMRMARATRRMNGWNPWTPTHTGHCVKSACRAVLHY